MTTSVTVGQTTVVYPANSVPDPVTGKVNFFNYVQLLFGRMIEYQDKRANNAMDVVDQLTAQMNFADQMRTWSGGNWVYGAPAQGGLTGTEAFDRTKALLDLGLIPTSRVDQTFYSYTNPSTGQNVNFGIGGYPQTLPTSVQIVNGVVVGGPLPQTLFVTTDVPPKFFHIQDGTVAIEIPASGVKPVLVNVSQSEIDGWLAKMPEISSQLSEDLQKRQLLVQQIFAKLQTLFEGLVAIIERRASDMAAATRNIT